MPVIRAIGAQAPRREAPVAGCWVTPHWSDKLGVTGHTDWPGMSSSGVESGESGLVGVLVARDTGSTVLACGFLVDVFCLGVKSTITQIHEGANQIQRMVMARQLMDRVNSMLTVRCIDAPWCFL